MCLSVLTDLGCFLRNKVADGAVVFGEVVTRHALDIRRCHTRDVGSVIFVETPVSDRLGFRDLHRDAVRAVAVIGDVRENLLLRFLYLRFGQAFLSGAVEFPEHNLFNLPRSTPGVTVT